MTEQKLWDQKYKETELAESIRRVNAVQDLVIGRLLRSVCRTGWRVLEAGSGSGRIVNFLCRYPDVFGVGVDYSDEGNALGSRTASALDADVRFVCGDLTMLPFPSGSFDLVFSDSVIEHLPNTQAAVVEMARVARPGGLVIITTPNRLRPDGWDLYKRLHRPPYLQKSFTPGQFRRLYAEAGLEIEQFFGDTLLLLRNFRRTSKRTPEDGVVARTPNASEESRGRYLRLERWAERFWPSRFWVNLGAVGRKS